MNPRETLTRAMQAYQSREEPEHLHALAGKYWRIMLSVEVVLFCAAIAGGAYMLVMTLFNFNENNTSALAPQSLNREELTQVLQDFDARKTLFEKLTAGAPPVGDPSR